MKILFTCPILDIRYEWLLGFMQILEQLKGYEMTYYIPYRKPLIIAQNDMGKKAIEGNFDYVLHMDDDIWNVPANAVSELIKADKEFISCVMYANDFPYQRCAGIRKNKNDSLLDIARSNNGGFDEATGIGIVPVDFSALPFTLIKTQVFKKITPPYFEYLDKVPTDSYFCQKMLDNGIQPYVHMDLQVNHRGVTHWNRIYKFIADMEFGLSTGQVDEKHRNFKDYLNIREGLVERYIEKKSVWLK